LNSQTNFRLTTDKLRAAAIFLATLGASVSGYALLASLAKKMPIEEFGAIRLLLETTTTLYPIIALGLQYSTIQNCLSARSHERRQLKFASALLLTALSLATWALAFCATTQTPPQLIGAYALVGQYLYVLTTTSLKELTNALLPIERATTIQCIHIAAPPTLLLAYVLATPLPITIREFTIAVLAINIPISCAALILTGISTSSPSKTVKELLTSNRAFGWPIYTAGYASMAGAATYQFLAGTKLSLAQYANLSVATVVASTVGLIATTVTMVKINELAAANTIPPNILKLTITIMTSVAMLICFAAWLLGERIAGPQYTEAVTLLPLLMAAAVFDGISYIYNRFFLAKKLAKNLAITSKANGLINLTLSISLIPAFGLQGAVAARLLTSACTTLANHAGYRSYTKTPA